MQARSYLRIAWRWGWLIALGTLLAAAVSYGWSRSAPPVYRTTATLLVDPGSNFLTEDVSSQAAEALARTYARLIVTRPVLDEAAQTLGQSSGQEIAPFLDVRAITNTRLVQISSEHRDPQFATDVANVEAATFIARNDAIQQDRLQASRASLAPHVAEVGREADQRSVALDALKAQRAVILQNEADVQDLVATRLQMTRQSEQLAREIERRQQRLDIIVAQPPPGGQDAEAQAAESGRLQRELSDSKATAQSLASQTDQLGLEIQQRQQALDNLRGQPTATGRPGTELDAEIARLEREVPDLQETYAGLLQSYERARLGEAKARNTVSIVEPAILPTAPESSRSSFKGVLGSVVGLLLTLGIVIVSEFFSRSVATTERLETALDSPTLAVVGELPKGTTSQLQSSITGIRSEQGRPNEAGTPALTTSREAEAYHVLRTNLQFSESNMPLQTVLITSAGVDEGKTTTAAGLAVAQAQAGFETLLVDADLRQPSLHQLFDLDNHRGLSSLLTHGGNPREYSQATTIPNLRVLTSGPIPLDPSGLLGSRRMSACLEECARVADRVVIDSSPVMLVSDALALAPQVDGVVLVVDARTTSRDFVLRVRGGLEQIGAPLVGAVLNRSKNKAGEAYPGAYRPRGRRHRRSVITAEEGVIGV
jgi:capsular exopolysaccharide synthesis family protein